MNTGNYLEISIHNKILLLFLVKKDPYNSHVIVELFLRMVECSHGVLEYIFPMIRLDKSQNVIHILSFC